MKIKRKKKPVVVAEKPEVALGGRAAGGMAFRVRAGVWDMYRDGVTQGLLANFMLCPEKAHLATVEGLTSVRTGGALAFGSLVHDTLDVVYSHVMRKKSCNDWGTFTDSVLGIALKDKEALDRKALVDSGSSNPEELVMLEENYGMAEGILPGYLRKWSSDFEEVEWLALEQEFSVPITFHMTDDEGSEEITLAIRGKRDGVFRSKKTRSLYLFETKTKGRVDEDSIMDRLVFDLQVMLYLWSMWKDYGEMPQGVVYNIIRKPQLRQKKDESLKQFGDRIRQDAETRPDFYYMRYNSAIIGKDLVEWEKEFVTILRQLVRWQRGEFHWKNSSACSMGGINCQFLSICSRGDRSHFKVKETPFPELNGGAEE